MKARKENKAYSITTEQEKQRYLKAGYDIYSDDGELVEYSPQKKVSYSRYDALRKENIALSRERLALRSENDTLRKENEALKEENGTLREKPEPACTVQAGKKEEKAPGRKAGN